MASHAPELIDFLGDHWFNVMTAHAAEHPFGDTPEETLEILVDLRQSFLNDLSKMPTEQLVSTARDAMIEQDLARPFNQFGTDADFEHFGKCAFLTVPESVALSLGKDPRFVDWQMVRPFLGKSIFAFEFAKRMDLIERAVIWHELPVRFTPLQFLTWAHRYKLSIPEAFIQRTFDRGEPIQYWHDLCAVYAEELTATRAELQTARDALKAVLDETEVECQRSFEDWLDAQEHIGRLNGEHETQLASLRDALAEAEKQNVSLLQQINTETTTASREGAMATTERKSLLTIAIASAVGGYGYDPKGSKSTAPQEIASEAQRLGLQTTDDTVRKYLKEAEKISGFVGPDMNRTKPKSV